GEVRHREATKTNHAVVRLHYKYGAIKGAGKSRNTDGLVALNHQLFNADIQIGDGIADFFHVVAEGGKVFKALNKTGVVHIIGGYQLLQQVEFSGVPRQADKMLYQRFVMLYLLRAGGLHTDLLSEHGAPGTGDNALPAEKPVECATPLRRLPVHNQPRQTAITIPATNGQLHSCAVILQPQGLAA